MKLYYIKLPGLLAVTGFYLGSNVNEKDPISKPKRVSAGESGLTVHSLVSRETNDVYYAILLMPKSYLPMLERFAKDKLSKDIIIVPAKIGTVKQPPANPERATPMPDFSAKIRAAAFLTFLACAKINRFK